jgi:hypothetical protein
MLVSNQNGSHNHQLDEKIEMEKMRKEEVRGHIATRMCLFLFEIV